MRLLLIGGNGFIGRFVLPMLRQQGHEVAVFHRGTSPQPCGVKEIRGDRNRLQDSVDQLRQFKPDVVIDLIISSVGQAEQLANTVRSLNCRIVMISSMDVYRAAGIFHGTESGSLQEVPLTEESDVRRNLHPYPRESVERLKATFSWLTDDYDKIPAERAVMSAPDVPGTVLRLPMIYGPGDPLHRLYPIVKRITDGRKHIIFAEPLAAWRGPRGYIENVANAIALTATDDRAAGRIYNVCEVPAFSELEWAQTIAREMHWDGEFAVIPPEKVPPHLRMRGNFAQHWQASSARIRNELGYKESVPLEEAIRRTVAWENENPPATPPSQFDYAAEDAAIAG